MQNLNQKIKNDVAITPEINKLVLFSILEDISVEKENLTQQAKVNFSLLEDVQVAEEKTAREKARIDAIVQNLTDGLASFDENGKVLGVNPRMAKFTGLPVEGFYLTEFARLFKGADVEAKIREAFEHRRNIHIEEVSLIGRFAYELFFTPIITPEGKVIGSLMLLHDITHLKEVEKMRQDFLSLASHQLRTPLSGTKWLVETVQSGVIGKLTKKQQEYMTQIYSVNERMIKLVSDLLSTLRLGSGAALVKKETISATGLYEEISNMMEPAAKSKGVILKNVLKNHKVVTVETDITMLRSIIECFISNAINYSNPGQEVILDAKEESTVVVFFVKDSGVGIPKEEQKRIFEKFYRASNAKTMKTDGTGLGLYMASMLAERIGAKISFESEEGKGSIFYLRIPKTKVENNNNKAK